jgi:HD-GYP domain-containing protein (c-di-GMP phosphodiesterase class II)
MNSFEVKTLKENTYFTDEVFLDKSFILLNNSTPVTGQLIGELTDWNFDTVYSEGVIGIARTVIASSVTAEQQKTQQNADTADNNTQPPGKSALEKALSNAHLSLDDTISESARIETVKSVYNEYLNYITAVYTRFATHKELNLDDLSKEVRELCIFIKDDKSYILRITPTEEALTKNYLANHSLRSTILALAIGLQLRMPLPKLIELGVATILHEIGMIRIPPQLYMTDKALTPGDRKQIFTHPVLSFQILKEANFPLSIQLGVLEHHEKENGQGYPQHLTGNKISLYAKIISVACSFEAITASRHYKAAKTSYEAMVEMLKNESLQYNPTIIKALLYTLSLFPIGAYVFLSNGKVAQVVDVNPDNPKNPIVEISGMADRHVNPLRIQTNDTDMKIVRVLTKQEADDVITTLTKNNTPLS